jgi:GNAT superfamily N-acetyltransferase
LKYAFWKEKSFSGYIVKNWDEIIAFALYHYGFDPYSFRWKCIYLISFFVSQKTRWQWVGTSLLEKLQSHDDSVWLFFPVWIRNKWAIEFYQKLGADWIEDVPYMKLMK